MLVAVKDLELTLAAVVIGIGVVVYFYIKFKKSTKNCCKISGRYNGGIEGPFKEKVWK